MTNTSREIPTKYPQLEIEEILAAAGLYTPDFTKHILDLSEDHQTFHSILLSQGFIEEDGELTEFAIKDNFFVDYGIFSARSGAIEISWLMTDRGLQVLVAYIKSQRETYSLTQNLNNGDRE